jgi:hypothetical protein
LTAAPRWLWAVCLAAVAGLVLTAGVGAADGYPVQYCAPVPPYTGSGIPAGSGIPPWGFHTGQPITGATGSYARAWGDINLGTSWISGKICQVDRVRGQPDGMIVMKPEPHIIYHTHYAKLWGYPGNLIKVNVKVVSSTDPRCKVGTVGQMTMYASYNGVRSDSVQFSFGASCGDHNHLYHGPQVNAQVPPL